jgi:hypothetical protein
MSFIEYVAQGITGMVTFNFTVNPSYAVGKVPEGEAHVKKLDRKNTVFAAHDCAQPPSVTLLMDTMSVLVEVKGSLAKFWF